MFEHGVVAEVRSALEQPISRTAAKTLGLDEIARLPPDDALERIVVQTSRYAAYQRKWMRRIPGLVTVDSNRPPTEVAAEIAARATRGADVPLTSRRPSPSSSSVRPHGHGS